MGSLFLLAKMEDKRIVEIVKVGKRYFIKAKCLFCGQEYVGIGGKFCSRKCAKKYAFKDRKWGNGLLACINCGKSDKPHWAHGLCESCRRKHKTVIRGDRRYYQRHKKELGEKQKLYKDKLINGGYRSEILDEGCKVCETKDNLVVFHLDHKSYYTDRKEHGGINNSRKNQVALCKRDRGRVNFGHISL